MTGKLPKISFIRNTYCAVVALLLLLGVIAIYSTSYSVASNYYLYRQILWIGVGICAAVGITLTPLDRLSRHSFQILLAIMLALAYLVFVTFLNKLTTKLGFSIAPYMPLAIFKKGACRWIGAFGVSIQPSEFAKFAVILFLATYYGMRDRIRIESLKEGLLLPGFICGIALTLILLGRALSNTVITGLIVWVIMFLAGVKTRWLTLSLVLAVLLAAVAVMATPYRRQRIVNFILKNKQEENATTGKLKADNHQLGRSICAIGSGGATGLGITHGHLKHKSIPESKTDFIFAVIGEELGYAGMLFAISLYLAFMVLSLAIAYQCPDKRGMLVCMAVGFFVPFQALFNLAVVCGLGPTTGVTAPLVSYGGSSIVSIMLCVGLVLNVGYRIPQENN